MNKLNFIFDGNSFCYKAISVYSGISDKKLFQIDKERDNFMKVLITNFLSDLYKFSSVLGKVVVVSDSRSWRYSIYEDYKGNRVKPLDIHWDNYAIIVNEFYALLSKYNVIISNAKNAEGDDMIYGWVNKFKNLNENSVIMSTDRDLLQLLYHNDSSFSIMYDTRYDIIFGMAETYEKLTNIQQEKIVDIFDISEEEYSGDIDKDIKRVINDFLLKKGIKYKSVNLEEFIFTKILTGDDGDNIKSAYYIIKNNKKNGIGDKGAFDLYSIFKNYKFKINDLYDDSKLKVMSEIVYNNYANKKTKLEIQKTCSFEEVFNNMKLNLNLMMLNDKSIPTDILNNINNNIDKTFLNENVSYKDLKNIYSVVTEQNSNSINNFKLF